MKHDYVAFMDKLAAPTTLTHLAAAFKQYNQRHPHKVLKYARFASSDGCGISNLTTSNVLNYRGNYKP
jgi:hypothetical protein